MPYWCASCFARTSWWRSIAPSSMRTCTTAAMSGTASIGAAACSPTRPRCLAPIRVGWRRCWGRQDPDGHRLRRFGLRRLDLRPGRHAVALDHEDDHARGADREQHAEEPLPPAEAHALGKIARLVVMRADDVVEAPRDLFVGLPARPPTTLVHVTRPARWRLAARPRCAAPGRSTAR